MTRVVVLGGSGMLGSMVVDYLARDRELGVVATVRSAALAASGRVRHAAVEWALFDCEGAPTWEVLEGASWIINAVGITKPLIRDNNPAEVARAIVVNAQFPHALGLHAQQSGARVLQIATDCVYSGLRGNYSERDLHDALDVYGKTKSLGESRLPSMHHLRCSIIGPEPNDHKFLIDWFLGQPVGAQLNGFVNHQWNGITTLQFAKICHGILTEKIALPHMQHVVPTASLSKADMLVEFGRSFGREDISVRRVEAERVLDRTLCTEDDALNRQLWEAACYSVPPTVPEMIAELARYQRSPVPVG